EIEKAILFYQTKNSLNPVRRVVLVGGSAMLPGMIVYLAENLGLEVQIGDPWVRVDASVEIKKELAYPENQAKFALAVGLAMRNT
ncbi:MAG: Type IV pilus assembly protein PilM, partial [Parcubacteria group bacterium GW2011_GWA2_39_18]